MNLKFNKKERGVAEVLGFLLVIVAVFIIFDAFMNTVVPSSVSSAEAQHYSHVISQVFQIKSGIVTSTSVSFFPYSIYESVDLGTQSIPILVPPSPGQINIIPYHNDNFINISFSTPQGLPVYFNGSTFIEIYLLNRVYPQEAIYFDNGMIATGYPNINVKNLSVLSNGVANYYNGTFSIYIISDSGIPYSYSGTGSVGLSININAVTYDNYADSGTINLILHDPLSYLWANFLKNITNGNAQIQKKGQYYEVIINNVNYVRIVYINVDIKIMEALS
ncbi:MAG: hypothetical protein ACP5JE_00035 [Thermoplasmata archaeon]|jgi:hypothetical protein